MDTSSLKPLISWLHLNPEWGYFLAFLFSFLEGLALIGLIIPGSVIMTVAGILAGSGILSISYLIFWSALGAFLGDYCSYAFGQYFQNDLKAIWPFKHFPKLIDKGIEFFKKHGGKSVFTGRFVGPVRPIIPVIAGSLRMSTKRFIFIDLLACILWPPAYMLPGFILGAASLALSPDASTRIIINLVLLLIIISFLYWFLELIIKSLINFIDKGVYQFWQFLKKHPRFNWLYNLLKITHIPDDHSQLGLALLACLTTILFLLLTYSVIIHAGIVHINKPLHFFLQSLYLPLLQKIMLIITYAAAPKNMLLLWAIILIWFGIKKDWYAMIHWAILGAISFMAIDILKHFAHSPRPNGLIKGPDGFSYPSGHTTLATAFYSYLALIIAHDKKRYVHYLSYLTAAFIIFLVGFSRLYLGVHWFTDVLGGLLLGLSISLFVALSYRKIHRKLSSLWQFLLLIFVTLVILISACTYKHFSTDTKDLSPSWQTQTLILSEWWKNGIPNQPLYRQDRLGRNVQTLNIEWLGSLKNIQTLFEEQGWQPQQKSLLLHTIHYFGEKNRSKILPLFPSLYHGKKPVLLLSEYDENNNTLLILRLWKSKTCIMKPDNSLPKPLWVGAIGYQPISFSKNKKITNLFTSSIPIKTIIKLINNHSNYFQWKLLDYSNTPPLATLEDNGWNGQILLIKEKTP